jgi:diguanylate cyclase (GGDEF)-like protein/putative nucleotidyltransferase with HDIG domain
MRYVHHCLFCGWHRESDSSAVVPPGCERCGCTLRADDRDGFVPMPDQPAVKPQKPSKSADIGSVFAAVAVGQFLLPLIGVDAGLAAFALPLALLVFAATRCAAAARRCAERATMWTVFAACAGSGAAASALAVVAAVTGQGESAAFYLGAAGSAGMLTGVGMFAREAVRRVSWPRLVDGLLLALVLCAIAIYFVVLPGIRRGDPVLTIVFLVDFLALLVAGVALIARRGAHHRKLSSLLILLTAGATAGDALVVTASAGATGSLHALTALCWAIAAYALGFAADLERRDPTEVEPPEALGGARWLFPRVVLPLTAVLALPMLAVGLWLSGDLHAWALSYFASFFVALLVLAFGRQAYLLLDNRRAVARERAMRDDAIRRNKELEALTGLATTMTQTLEEAPIVEQALSVLHLAARASSSALHLRDETTGDLVLSATTGDWTTERAWGAPRPAAEKVSVETRGRRQVGRLALAARETDIGVVTFLRGAHETFSSRELELLTLLVDQMAVAIQNARDYREKLEQAIRDPLTGLYNRRFFYEAFEKEIQRYQRYGSSCSIVIFDVDDFKQVNDTLGHATGDDVLRRLGALVEGLIRPVDSFARMGGEEFALLMPETEQLDALLVAERLRTAISRHRFLHDRRITVSAGVASCPTDAIDRVELQQQADSALYWAKRNGKDICAVASEVTTTEIGTNSDGDGMLAHLYGVVARIDAQTLQTRDHSENVAAYAVTLGQELGLEHEHVVRLRRAALLHDIGKVAVAGAILEKPSRLTDAEFEHMKIHPTVGATMVAHAGFPEEARWIRHSHERVDGQGYPAGLVGDEIPLESRILLIADAFEAMTSDRPYRAGMDVGAALGEIRRCAGSQFDPAVADTFIRLVERGDVTLLAMSTPAQPINARTTT